MYFWKEAQFEMDVERLKLRLTNTQLVLGNVKDTVSTFFKDYNPVRRLIMFDLDFY